MSQTPNELIRDLRQVGVHVDDVWDLVNAKYQYRAAIPVLIEWLQQFDERVTSHDSESLREAIVRALTVPAARSSAAPALIDEFQKVVDPTGLALRWVIGNALAVVAGDEFFDDIASLIRNKAYGKSRQMLVLGLARSKDPRAVGLLLDLLIDIDEDVAVHALKAIGQRKELRARPVVESMLDHPQALIRREAKKALSKIDG